MPDDDDHTVTSSAEAHNIIMCAVGSTPAQLGNTSKWYCEEPKHTK